MPRKLILLLCCVCLCSALFSQDVQQPVQEELQQTSSLIKSKLQDLKTESDYMRQQLTELSASLKESDAAQNRLRLQSKMLSDSLMSINESLNSSYETITKYEQQIKQQKRLLNWLLAIVIFRIATTGLGYILYVKGVKLPRWLDILL